MKRIWTCAALALAVSAAALLAACGSGSTVSDLHPTRAVAVGDGFMDVGQVGAMNPAGALYTVNDGSTFWLQQLVSNYGLTLKPASSGGFGYAEGGACVTTTATCNTPARTITAQVDDYLSRGAQTDDMVFVSGGIEDIVANVNAALASGTAPAAVEAAVAPAVNAAGAALAQQIGRIFKAGAGHVLVTGVVNLGNTPWAQAAGVVSAATNLSNDFNNNVLTGIEGLSTNAHVLFSGVALLGNLAYNNSGNNYGFSNNSTVVCGTTPVLSCTPSTTVDPANYNKYIFASDLYFTPAMLNLFANNNYAESVYYRIQQNW